MKQLRGNRERARNINFNNVYDVLKEHFADSGISKNKLWKLATARAKAMAAAWVAGFEKQSEEAQKISMEINEQYFRNLDEVVKDIGRECSVDANSLKAQETQYLSQVSEGVHMMFVCRMPGCMYFGMNDQWVKSKLKEQFKCPACGIQYKPGSSYGGEGKAIKAAYVMQIVDPLTHEISRIPVSWPPSEELNGQKSQGTCFRTHTMSSRFLGL